MDIDINYEEFFVVLLTGIATSIVAVVFYSIFIILWGKGTYFGYVRLFFTSSIICGGVLGAYFTHVNNNGVGSIIYGLITSLIIFLLIGLAIVNVYGA
jgi:hypothetical protein